MQLSYNLQDAELWAAFSGDFNPIHFDLNAAGKLGISGLCVHGMRAMLDIKSSMGARLSTQLPQPKGFIFSSRLRGPVICDTPCELQVEETLRNTQLHVSSALRDLTTGQNCISSKLMAATAPERISAADVYRLSGDELMNLAGKFPDTGNVELQPWSFLDAVLFQQLLNSPAALDSVRQIAPELFCDNPQMGLGDIFTQVQVVQTHHETHFRSNLISPAHLSHLCDAFDYAILPTLVMGDKQSGLILCARLHAWRAEQPLINVGITLKTAPIMRA